MIKMKRSHLLLAAGILTLSVSSIIVKLTDAPGPVIAFYRIFFAAVMLAPFYFGKGRQNGGQARERSRKVILYPILTGLANALDYSLTILAMKMTFVANATILNNIAPIWVGVASVLFFRRKLTKKYWLGIALAFVGAAMVIGNNFFREFRIGTGDLLAVCSSFFYAAYFLISQKGREYYSALEFYCLMLFSSSVWLFLVNLIMKNPFTGYTLQTWILLLIAALFCQVLGQFSITAALGELPANVVSTTMLFQPFLSAVLALFILGEKMMALQWFGGAVALFGIYLVNREQNRPAKEASGG